MNNTQFPEVTRRLFLKRSFAVLATVAALPSLSMSETIKRAEGQDSLQVTNTQTLSVEIYNALEAATDTYIPHGGAFETGAVDIKLASKIVKFLEGSDAAIVTGVTGALTFLEFKSSQLINSSKTFTQLTPVERESVLNAMIKSDGMMVQIYSALRGLCFFQFYTDSKVWHEIGYDGPLLEQFIS